MTTLPDRLVLDNVPKIENMEYPDIFSDALRVALSYQNDELSRRFPHGAYDAISGFTGRGWLVGFDDDAYYADRSGVKNPPANFAVSSLEAYLEHAQTLYDAVRFVDRVPEFLWNRDCTLPIDPRQAAGFKALAQEVSAADTRQFVLQSLMGHHRPVIVLLDLPQIGQVEMALVTGWEALGDEILIRSPYQQVMKNESGPFGYGRVAGWEDHVLAVMGVGVERKAVWPTHPCYTAAENALRCASGCTRSARHYGLAAYDAWERALLDEEAINGVDDIVLARRLLVHSATAGVMASQKAFTVLPAPDDHIPCMGVLYNLVRRASAGPQLIHGLMWDVWQVVGGYWRGAKDSDGEDWVVFDNPDEISRFRDRSIRERAVKVIRRACQVDAQSLQDLQDLKDEWDLCLARGDTHSCPCWDRPCARIKIY